MSDHTILLADDSSTVRTMLSRILKDAGFHVIAARDGREALELAQTCNPSLAILDIVMPVMDGYATLEKLKESGKLDSIAVVMVTSVDEIESVAKCIELGAADYMPKLFNPILLDARIKSNLERLFMRRKLNELKRSSKFPS